MSEVAPMSFTVKRLSEEIKKELKKQKERGLTHNFDHLERVHKIAMFIARKEKADKEIVGTASFLHDIVFFADDKKNETHPDQSARLARTILKRIDFPKDKINKVIEAIQMHDLSYYSNKYRKLPSLEAQIVLEADKIDSIGATGLVRNCTLIVERNIEIFSPQIIDKMINFVNRAKRYIKTETGKKLFNKRYLFTIAFFNELKKEMKSYS